MDGVLSDFTSSALQLFNSKLNKNLILDEYVKYNLGWNIEKAYNISVSDFWKIINEEENFWINLKPFPWAVDLIKFLRQIGEITIVTTPSLDPDCARQKLEYLYKHFRIKSDDVFLGAKKYLMAGNGILIDDSPSNINKFKYHGGHAILIPSNWNTLNLNFEQVKQTILNYL